MKTMTIILVEVKDHKVDKTLLEDVLNGLQEDFGVEDLEGLVATPKEAKVVPMVMLVEMTMRLMLRKIVNKDLAVKDVNNQQEVPATALEEWVEEDGVHLGELVVKIIRMTKLKVQIERELHLIVQLRRANLHYLYNLEL